MLEEVRCGQCRRKLPMDVVGITYSVGGGSKPRSQTGELIIRNREAGFGGNLSLL